MSPSITPLPDGSPFNRDRFLFRQKLLSINERYDAVDEDGTSLFFIERPRRVFRNLLAMLTAMFTFFAVAIGSIMLGVSLDKSMGSTAAGSTMIAGGIIAIVATILVAVFLAPKRHVTFFADTERTLPLLHIRQDFKLAVIDARYTIHLPDGAVLGSISKNLLTDFWRKRWRVLAPDGTLLAEGREDSWFFALLRRIVPEAIPFMRTNFIILTPDGNQVGIFNRKLTILDRYVLDLSGDPGLTLDRRVGVALGIMLDTGEGR